MSTSESSGTARTIIGLIIQTAWNAFCTVVYAFFSAWMMTLVNKFSSEGRTSDRDWAMAILAFLILATIGRGFNALSSAADCLSCQPPKARPAGISGPVSCPLMVLAFVASLPLAIVFSVRVWTWFAEFHAAGDVYNSVYSALLGVAYAVGIFELLVGLAIVTAGLCMVASVMREEI